VKLDADTLSTVPDAPPEAAPDRALAPPLPGTGRPDVAEGDVVGAEGDAVVAEGDVAQPAENPITAHISAAARIPPVFLFDTNRRTPDRRACLDTVTEADESGGGGSAAPAPLVLPATAGPDVALETGPAGRVSW
jgi:hypothetical protein